jgi:DNA repair protein RecO (recombination protein O)
MQYCSDALVIHCIKQGEQSLVARLFTRQFGLVSFLFKGVFNRKSSKSALLQPMNFVQVNFKLKENSDLIFGGELKGLSNYRNIPFQPTSIAQLSFINEVLFKTLRFRETDEVLFDYLLAMLQMLDESHVVMPDFHLRFLIDYAHFLGFGIEMPTDDSDCFFNPSDGVFSGMHSTSCWSLETTQQLIALASTTPSQIAIQSNRIKRNQMLGLLLDFYRHHIPSLGTLKSPDVLQAVFE